MNVLLTGAAGHMATLALPGLQGHHALRLTDVRRPVPVPVGIRWHPT